jgi:hypothetical protein
VQLGQHISSRWLKQLYLTIYISISLAAGFLGAAACAARQPRVAETIVIIYLSFARRREFEVSYTPGRSEVGILSEGDLTPFRVVAFLYVSDGVGRSGVAWT